MSKALTIFVTLMAASGVASADSLREATRDAMRLCVELEARSLEHCGMQMPGKTPQHSAARKTVLKVTILRSAVVRQCENFDPKGTDCYYKADAQTDAGIGDALNGPVTYLRSTAPR